jgi:hypothetical protein
MSLKAAAKRNAPSSPSLVAVAQVTAAEAAPSSLK